MIKKLIKYGSNLALAIDKGVLDILNIDDKTPLNISTDGKVLIVSPIRDHTRSKEFEAALEKTNNKFSKALRNLAQ
ncbi:MAG: AbrB/MazE/SpoVT family DNA-binding domain-containing protein [Nitrospirae bacterium]|nr:AbrB/MazE/SpoVT family DNA-binding domain-containing protein [Nitrospirota bacterium]